MAADVRYWLHVARGSPDNVVDAANAAWLVTLVGLAGSLTALGIGCWLLIEKQLNIGQFVAAEIVIILTIGAVEKLVLKLDVVYDALTSLDKIGHVLDLEPVTPTRGTAALPATATPAPGLAVEVRDLNYQYPGKPGPTLTHATLTLKPGEHLALAGADGAGKTTLLRLLAGLLEGYTGQIVYDGLPLADLNPDALAGALGDNLAHQHLFSGTVLDNITLGQPHLTAADAAWAIELVGLRDEIFSHATGLHTPVGPGHPLGTGTVQKLLLARALVGRPRLLLLDHLLPAAALAERVRVLRRLLAPELPWTLVLGTTQPELLALLPRVAVLNEGHVVADGPLDEVRHTLELQALLVG